MNFRLITFTLFYFISSSLWAKKATIRWSAIEEAKKYEIEVSRNGKIVDQEETKKTKVRLSLPPGDYLYRVRAIDETGTASPWTPTQNFIIPIKNPTCSSKVKEKSVSVKWKEIEEATSYRIKITKDGNEITNQEMIETGMELNNLNPGKYTYTVQSIIKREGEPDYLNSSIASNSFKIEFPLERTVATIENTETKLEVKKLSLKNEFNLDFALFPYEYKTLNSNATTKAQGAYVGLDFNTFISKTDLLLLELGVIGQLIDTKQILSKRMGVAYEKQFPLIGTEDDPSLLFKLGGGVQFEDWFHLTTAGSEKETFSTIGPSFHIGFEKLWYKYTLEGTIASYMPLKMVGSSTDTWALDGISNNLSIRLQAGYLFSNHWKLKGGVAWLPRRLNLQNGNYIENQGYLLLLSLQYSF